MKYFVSKVFSITQELCNWAIVVNIWHFISKARCNTVGCCIWQLGESVRETWHEPYLSSNTWGITLALGGRSSRSSEGNAGATCALNAHHYRRKFEFIIRWNCDEGRMYAGSSEKGLDLLLTQFEIFLHSLHFLALPLFLVSGSSITFSMSTKNPLW